MSLLPTTASAANAEPAAGIVDTKVSNGKLSISVYAHAALANVSILAASYDGDGRMFDTYQFDWYSNDYYLYLFHDLWPDYDLEPYGEFECFDPALLHLLQRHQ